MKLLIVTNNPQRASYRQRIGIYLPVLRDNGIECQVAPLPSGSLARWKLLKRAEGYDGVFLHKKALNFIDAFRLKRSAKKLIYDFDDAIMYSPGSPEHDSRAHLGRFRRIVKMADMIIAGNSYLAEHARRFNPDVEVLPTGLDTSVFKQDAKKDKDKVRLVWIGSKSTLDYLAEIRPALEEIGSRFDNVVLRIICDEFIHIRNMAVEECRWSEQKETTDLVTSDIGLAPLPDNRFTRGKCGFKILQYAAAGLPVIASPVGVNADYVREGVNGFLASDCSEWIEKISLLVRKSELRKKMGEASKQQVQQFDVEVLGGRLVELIKKCLKG